MIKNAVVKILSNYEVAPMHYRLLFKEKALSKKILPGQFIHIKFNNTNDPMLRRPFSVFSSSGGEIEILYKVIGRGTEILSKLKEGDKLDIIAPCGNSFLMPKDKSTLNIVVAGGMGIAPMHALCLGLLEKKREMIIFLGAKSKKFLICLDELKKLKVKTHITTDDGTFGNKGLVTGELQKFLPKLKRNSVIYVCGPHVMMYYVSRLAKDYDIPCQVSLEEKMACGVGACMGCSVLTRSGYKNVCSDGPVFNSKEIVW